MSVNKNPRYSKNRQKHKKFQINKKWIILGLLVLILSLFVNIWAVAWLVIFCVGNSILLAFNRYFDGPLDPEISTFSAILMTLKYGLNFGIATAILTKFVSMLYIKKIKANYFFMMIGYVSAALLANLFRGLHVITLGFIVTVLANVIQYFIRKFVVNYSDFEVFSYGFTNIIFNVILFVGFSEILLFLMV
jgi:hypothetical protein